MVLEEVSNKGTYLSEESNLTILKQIPLLSDHRPGHSLLFLTALSSHPLGRLLPHQAYISSIPWGIRLA